MTATATGDTTLLRYGCGTAAGLPAGCEHGCPHEAATPGPCRRASQAQCQWRGYPGRLRDVSRAGAGRFLLSAGEADEGWWFLHRGAASRHGPLPLGPRQPGTTGTPPPGSPGDCADEGTSL